MSFILLIIVGICVKWTLEELNSAQPKGVHICNLIILICQFTIILALIANIILSFIR